MFHSRHSSIMMVLAVLFLTVLGAVMLFSSSAFAVKQSGDPYFYVVRQGVFLAIGIVCACVAASVNYRVYEKYAPWILGAACVLLVLCLIPGIGTSVKGSRRWFRVASLSFQPSEAAKVACIIFMSFWLAKYQKHLTKWNWGFLYPLGILALPLGLILIEPDLGATGLIGVVMISLMFIAGVSLKYVIPSILALPAGIIAIAVMMPERMGRLLSFLKNLFHPGSDRTGDGYQVWQALIALGSGGIEGLGLGNGRQKMRYLPEAHTDFILPVIGEELGVFWTLLIVFSFILVCVSGFMISMNARDRFGMYLGLGCTLMISLQAVINIGVVTSMLPNKGMPLPFISYGGTNLLMCLIMVGILLNIYRHGNEVPEHDPLAVKEHTPRV